MDGRPDLTPRELAVLEGIGRRLSNPEIAAEFFVSVRTVESHVAALRRKLGVGSRRALIEAARDRRSAPVLVPANSFVGREEDLAAVNALFRSRRCVTLTGPAGCGKTRLALEIAAGTSRTPLVVELENATEADLLPTIARSVGLGPAPTDGLVAACGVALAAEPHLLVLDNVDRVLATAARTTGVLMAYAPTLRVLATSRTPTGDPDETVYALGPLDVADAAVRLFLDRARAAAPTRDLTDTAAAASICRRLDGLPLAIELAAARVRHLPLSELARRLERGFTGLERRDAGGRHSTLAAAFDWTWDLLDEPERALLSRLAGLPGSFDLAAVEAISPEGGSDVLLDLLDRSLVSPAVGAAPGDRFRLLASLREFVLDRTDPHLVPEVRRAHTEHVARVATGLAVAARTDDSPGAVGRWARLAPEAAAALDWSLASGSDLAVPLAAALAMLMEQYGADNEVLLALARAAQDPAVRRGATMTDLATIGRGLSFGDMGVVASLARHVATRPVRDDRDELARRYLAGLSDGYLQDLDPALDHLAAAESAARRLGDHWMLASVHQARGSALRHHDPPVALAQLQLAIDGYAAAGDAMHVNNARYMMAAVAAEAGEQTDLAIGWAEQCATYARAVGNRHELAHALLTRARLTADVADLPGALETFRVVGDLRCLTRSLVLLADLSAHPDRVSLLEEAHQVAVRSHQAVQQASALSRLVTAQWAAGDRRGAAVRFGMLTALVGREEAADLAPVALLGDLDVWRPAVAEGIARQTGPGDGPVEITLPAPVHRVSDP